ncbi:MAG: ribonuclease R [Rhodothalassiaceae bacterium]
MSEPAKKAAFPDRAAVLRYIEQADGKVTKRDIARAFHIKGQDKIALKKLLRDLMDEGVLEKDHARSLKPAGTLPSVTVIEVAGTDIDGDTLARPLKWDGEEPPPKIFIAPQRGRGGPRALGRGERALAKLSAQADGSYEARIIKVLAAAPRSILGVFKGSANGGRLTPVDKRAKDDYYVAANDVNGATDGDLVLGLPGGNQRFRGMRPARVTEILGDLSAPKSISLIAIHAHGIPVEFPREAVQEAEAAEPVALGKRIDLRARPLVTIDPPDARDHDDAIHAEADDDPKNPGGYRLTVAIADVAHYVRPDSALDRCAKERGNSCYFPDRVVPMLPEALSADLCSLKPGVDRPCLFVEIVLDAKGTKKRHKFGRGLMRSAANMTYERAQAAIDGTPDGAIADLVEPVLKPLYAAHDLLELARARRQPLELHLPERRIVLNDAGRVVDIATRQRLRAHRLVEDFMILANVCAAETLERRSTPCMYRVHEEPPMSKMEGLQDFLDSLNMTLAKGQVMRPAVFNRVLQRAEGSPHERLVNEVILRSQTQAYYSPDNRGHFGLALPRYAHFTSPIRRYSDLMVHRGLIRAMKLGTDGLTGEDEEQFAAIGEHISKTERRAMAAERDSTDRYLASYLADKVGQIFTGRISGVTRFGLFVTLEPMGGDGLIPIGTLGEDFFVHDEAQHALVGRRTGELFRLGDTVQIRLIEAVPVSGGLRLELIQDRSAKAAGRPKRKLKKRAR